MINSYFDRRSRHMFNFILTLVQKSAIKPFCCLPNKKQEQNRIKFDEFVTKSIKNYT
jgi:hypothetical protein